MKIRNGTKQKQAYKQTNKQTNIHTNKQTNKQTNKERKKETNKQQTNKQTNKQTTNQPTTKPNPIPNPRTITTTRTRRTSVRDCLCVRTKAASPAWLSFICTASMRSPLMEMNTLAREKDDECEKTSEEVKKEMKQVEYKKNK
jgi:hypothetical protein